MVIAPPTVALYSNASLAMSPGKGARSKEACIRNCMSTRCAVRSLGSKGSSGGFTLLEVMAAAGLGAMVLYVVLALLIPALRVSAQGTTKVDLDQRASLLEGRLTRALKKTTRAGVGHIGWDPDQDERFLTVHPLLGSLSGSKQHWSGALEVFRWAGSRLQEIEVPLPPPLPLKAVTLEPSALQELLADDRAPSFVLEGVIEFDVVVHNGPQVDFSFVLEKGTQTLEVRRTVFLVNSSQ